MRRDITTGLKQGLLRQAPDPCNKSGPPLFQEGSRDLPAFHRDAVPSNNRLTRAGPASTLAIRVSRESCIDAQEKP